MHSFSMRPAKYFYDKPLTKYLDPKTVLIYRPHPVHVKLLLIIQELDVAIAKVQIEKRIRLLKIFKQKYIETISNILNS